MRNKWADAYIDLYDQLKELREKWISFRRKYPSNFADGQVEMISEVVKRMHDMMPKGEDDD